MFIFIGAAYIILNPQSRDEERHGPPRFAAALGVINAQTSLGMCLNEIIHITSYDDSILAMDILKKTAVNDNMDLYTFVLEFGRYLKFPEGFTINPGSYAVAVSMQGYTSNDELKQVLSFIVCDKTGTVVEQF